MPHSIGTQGRGASFALAATVWPAMI